MRDPTMKPNTTSLSHLHWPLILVTLAIAGLGIYNLHSSAAAHAPNLYMTQIGWLGVGAVVCLLVTLVDYRWTESIAYIVYGIVCVILLAVLLQGKSAGGARRWITLGPIGFQPSELAKLGTVLCLARYFSTRLHPRGYTLRGLLAPLNPSRPLAVAAGIALSWNNPWLVDPIGQLARGIRGNITDELPFLANLTWFRALLVVLLTLSWVGTIVLIIRIGAARALLDPWPSGRKRQLIALSSSIFVSLGTVLAVWWDSPVLRDPFGTAIDALYKAAAPGGALEVLTPHYTLRIILVACTVLYFCVSLLALRSGRKSWVDMMLAPADLLLLPFALILVEPDLGTAGLVGLVGFTMILIVGVRVRSLIVLAVIGTVVAVIGWFGILKDYQKRRILTFIDPEHDLMGAGWNAVQSLIAVGSGRWVGKGHMGGTQTQLSFLPEQHTDFAFSVWSEEQGFVGCVLVLFLYFILLALALGIAADARDTYGALLASGIASIILWQAIINVSMVIGVFPVVGVPLPMFSYGGTSLLTVVTGIGLLLNIHWRRRTFV